jgi:aldehyde dehydrogenase (NAD+)
MEKLKELLAPINNSTTDLSLDQRIAILKKLKNIISDRAEDIHHALSSDLGKCRFESYISEIDFSIHEIEVAIKSLRKWSRPKKVRSSLVFFPVSSYIHKQPLGKVLIIGPWNYPFQLIIAPLIGAIAAGNRVVMKPSEIAPNTSKMLCELLNKNFGRDVMVVVEGGIPETTYLLDQKFDHIFYTGNGVVGRIVLEKAAKFLTPVTLELGGKSPAFVYDTDLSMAAKRILWGKYFNSGQTCVAPDYVLIPSKDTEKFLDYCRYWLKQFFGEDISNCPDYGRIINERHFDRIKSYLDEDVESLITSGEDRDSLFMGPIIVRAQKKSKVMQEEIFGPILPILEVDKYEDALQYVASNDHPLACYGFIDSDKEDAFLQLKTGGMVINDTIIHLSNERLPFGGIGPSGMGRYHGQYSFDTFSHDKAVMKKPFWGENSLRYPPYEGKLNLIRKVLSLLG